MDLFSVHGAIGGLVLILLRSSRQSSAEDF